MTQLCRSIVMRTVFTGALLMFANAAQAQGSGPGFHAAATGNLDCAFNSTVSSAVPPVTVGPVSWQCVNPGGTGTGAARADAGRMGVFAGSEHTEGSNGVVGNGGARIRLDNVVVRGPAASSLPVTINYHLRGTIHGSGPRWGASIRTILSFNGGNLSSNITTGDHGIVDQSGVFAPLALSFSDVVIDHDFVSGQLNIIPNLPMRLELRVLATAGKSQSSAGPDIGGPTETDFFSGTNGFSFRADIPVFNLPEGYKVDIPELNIFDNHWYDPSPPPDTTPPVITPSVSGTLGNAGFFTSDVSVSWNVGDPETAVIAQNGCDVQTVVTDTAGTTFTCSATSAGGTATESITIKRDTEAPLIILPVNLAVDAVRPLGAAVTYTPSAVDLIDPVPTLTCTPASGTVFPIGTSTVTCTAGDAAGNPQAASFSVRVRGAAEQILALFEKTVLFQGLPPLDERARAPLAALIDALVADRPTACRFMNLYIVSVQFAPTAQFTLAEKSELIADARRIRLVIGCS